MKTNLVAAAQTKLSFVCRRRAAWGLAAILIGLIEPRLAHAWTYVLTNGNSTATIQVDSPAGMTNWMLDDTPQLKQQWFWYRQSPETRDRSLIAVVTPKKQVYLGWRLLSSDPKGVAFNVYRSTDRGPLAKLNTEPIRASTDFVDKTVSLAKSNYWQVKVVIEGVELSGGTGIGLLAKSKPLPYQAITLKSDYVFSKVGIADLDGDGKLDFVIKQPQQVTDPGVWKPSPDSFKVEAYRHDGSLLWRRDLGVNIEQGVWWSPMIVADFDGDGKAEVALKTAPLDVDYRNKVGRVLTGPEWLSVLDGLTGQEIARVDWPARGDIAEWGDKVGNRASRHLIGFAKLDGKRTSVLALRGTYTKMLVDAYNLVGGKLEKVWSWNGDEETPKVRGQGMHGMHAADVDGDGREEIILGAAVIDDNGKALWNLQMGHPDVCYVTDVIPDHPGLEIAYGFETAQEKNGFCVVDAKTGKILWGCDHMTTHVHSQGLLADIDPKNPGLEFYGGEKFLKDRWLYSATDGKLLSREDFGTLAPNPIYWDDSYVKPYLTKDGDIVKYKGVKLGQIEGKVIAIADILGDWREEIITSVPGELRIYTTTIPATRRNVWLMEDPIYRNDVSHVSMGYLYPPQLTKPMTAETKP
jgi:rhamnogalacturonan endolyase